MIPLNMGIGAEIGLPPDIQKMWDPDSKKVSLLILFMLFKYI